MAIRSLARPAIARLPTRIPQASIRHRAPDTLNRRSYSHQFSQISTELQGYHELIHADDATKIKRIAQKYFITDYLDSPEFFNKAKYGPLDLMTLLDKVKCVESLPIHTGLHQPLVEEEALHFETNSTFINLPYTGKTQTWSDRFALQELIRKHFSKLYQVGDLAIVPGCADGQIAIEIYGNSLEHGIKLKDILAADYNLPAMQLGYVTMKAFGLNPNRIKWMQANIAHESFFRWVNKRYPNISGKHQISTLIQPSLTEESLLAFLKHCAHLTALNQVTSTIVMPVLLADPKSEWHETCDQHVQHALIKAKSDSIPPAFIWNKTKYGIEFLRRIPGKKTYVPQQYFIDPSQLKFILTEFKLQDVSKRIFSNIENPEDYTQSQDPRLIAQAPGSSAYARRIFCIWEATIKV